MSAPLVHACGRSGCTGRGHALSDNPGSAGGHRFRQQSVCAVESAAVKLADPVLQAGQGCREAVHEISGPLEVAIPFD